MKINRKIEEYEINIESMVAALQGESGGLTVNRIMNPKLRMKMLEE